MKVLDEYNTLVVFDDDEQFDVQDTDYQGRSYTVHVTDIRRYVYPAQGGGFGTITHGSGRRRRKSDGELGTQRDVVHFGNRPELKAQIPAVLMERLDELGLFDDVPEA